jgi:hypothetical protein
VSLSRECSLGRKWAGQPFVGLGAKSVIGTDKHKTSHTVAAVDGATGQVLEDRTVRARRRSFEDLLGRLTAGPSEPFSRQPD